MRQVGTRQSDLLQRRVNAFVLLLQKTSPHTHVPFYLLEEQHFLGGLTQQLTYIQQTVELPDCDGSVDHVQQMLSLFV
jgi:hypothetical protein